MTFTPNIPQASQSLGQTQQPIQNNFTNYNNLVSVDHVAPNALNQGNHKQVTFYQYGAAPYTTGANQSFLYTLNASAAGSQLVYQPTIVNPGFAVPVSPRALGRISRTGATTYSLVGGAYGASTSFNAAAPTGGFSNSFVFNFLSPLATTDYFVMISLESNVNNPCSINTKTTSGFNVTFGASATPPTFFAIMVF